MVRMGAKDVKSEDDVSGFQRPLPGRYHVVVKHVDESFKKFDKIIVDFEVLAGTVPDMQGRELSEFFAVTDKAIPRLQRLALCLRLLQPGEPDRDVEFANGVGRDLVIEIEENNYKDKNGKEVNGVRVGYLGMWSTINATVADVPKANIQQGSKADQGETVAPAAATEPVAAASKAETWADI
jgi:hypothetical protein